MDRALRVRLLLAIASTVCLVYVVGIAAFMGGMLFLSNWWGDPHVADFVLNWLWVVCLALWFIWGFRFVKEDE